MQENTRVVVTLGLAGALLVLMGLGVWLVIRERAPSVTEVPASPVEVFTEGQVETAMRAVGVSGLLEPCVDRFRLRMGRYPHTLNELVEPPQDSSEAQNWNGPYLGTAQLLTDPWGKLYRIRTPGTHNQDRYDLWSAGPDGVDNTADDIGNW